VLDPLASIIDGSITRDTVLLPFTLRGYFAQQWYSSPMQTLSGRQYSFKQVTQFSTHNRCMTLQLLTLIFPLQEMQAWFHSLERGVFAQSWCSSPMKTLIVRQYYFKQQTQFKMQNNVLDPLHLSLMVLLQETQCFFHSLERSYFAQSWCSLHENAEK
jgi:hypothetical protein